MHSDRGDVTLAAMCLGTIERVAEVWDAGGARQGLAECGAVISLAFAPEAEPGSYVLVHAGVAVRLLESREAEEATAMRQAMDA